MIHFPRIPSYDLILDCTDNAPTRHLVNSFAVAYGIPLISGGAVRAEGVVGGYNIPLPPSSPELENQEKGTRGPCYHCLFPFIPPVPTTQLLSEAEEELQALQGRGSCAEEGVLGIVCGQVGIGMASEGIKLLLGLGRCLILPFFSLKVN